MSLIGDEAEAARARELARAYDNQMSLFGLTFLAFTAATLTVGFLPWPKLVPWIRLAMALCGGTTIAFGTQSGEPKRPRASSIVLGCVAVAAVCLLIMYFWKPSNSVSFLAYFGPAVISGIISSPSSDSAKGSILFPEDQALADAEFNPLSRLTNAAYYLLRGTLPRPHGKEGKQQ